MNITEVHVRLTPKGKLKAFVSITIDGWFAVRGLKVIEKASGELFVAMPTRDENGRDICHPIHRDGRTYLTERVLREYALEQQRDERRGSADDGPGDAPTIHPA